MVVRERDVEVFLCVVLLYLFLAAEARGDHNKWNIKREDFPRSFVFGAATSASQVEGAALEDGRSTSIWDTFAHSGKSGQDKGDVGCDQYHQYKEDVKLMHETGLEAYRFSIAWPRLIPNGRGEINPVGLRYYNNLINELVSYGIEPHVTIYHADLPQCLEDEYKGWLSPRIVEDFTAFAEVCFREFGDRVKHWTTINEPNAFAMGGYDLGILPPNRCSYPFGTFNCTAGNSVTEPYLVVHNSLLSHASAGSLYKTKYQAKQKGSIGLNVLAIYYEPVSNSTLDIRAARRAQDFLIGWMAEPLLYGDYPVVMKEVSGWKLPKFSKNQSEQLRCSFDFIGLNYYYNVTVGDQPGVLPVGLRDYKSDVSIRYAVNIDEKPSPDRYVPPYGIRRILEFFKQKYGNPQIYIQENGYAMHHSRNLDDTPRVEYLSAHMESVLGAIRNGSNTVGYFTWALMDLRELFLEDELSYGLYYVDFHDKDLKRYPKLSATWYSEFLKGRENSIFIGTNFSKTAALASY